MTFSFDTTHHPWTADEDDRAARPSWVPLAVALIVTTGAGAAAVTLRFLGA